jgi:hypothetical protein
LGFGYILLFNQNNADEDNSIQQSIMLKNKEVDKEIQALINSGNYDFKNPLVSLDPYETAPLSAIIGFVTDEEMEIRTTVVGDIDETVSFVIIPRIRSTIYPS